MKQHAKVFAIMERAPVRGWENAGLRHGRGSSTANHAHSATGPLVAKRRKLT
jgi:hypothetical protein